MMRLRQPIVMPVGRKLRVLIQARFSTEEQRQSSIDDQIMSCRRFLAESLPAGTTLDQVEIEEIREPEISGELRDRPGIDQVWAGIEAKRWDVIIAEESSRLYRNMTFTGALFIKAHDARIRILCPTDMIDMADEDWQERMVMAQSQHSRVNHYTRARIRRTLTGRWELGSAVSALKVGYRRRPSRPATAMAPAEGPHFDEIDDAQAPIIREIFDRVARGEAAWAVGDWLTSIGFAKAKNGQKPGWSEKNVVELVRRPDYRGEQTYRTKVQTQQLTTGRSRPEWNDPNAVLTRQVPHLRIVSDHVWYAANAAIDSRRTRSNVPRGADHPLAGKPRDSRGLLSMVFVCGICGGIMHADGRNEGGYRCSRARHEECWNRTTCLRDHAHEAILSAVARAVMSIADSREQIVAHVLEMHASGGDIAAELRKLKSDESRLLAAIDKLGSVIETADGELDVLVQRLKGRQRDLKIVQSKVAELEARARDRRPPPSAADILRHLESLHASLIAKDSRAGVILRQLLVGPIRAVPYLQIGSTKVVLRAEFTLSLAGALPPEVASVTQADPGAAALRPGGTKQQLLVDLFVPSQIARHAMKAHELANTGMTLVEIGNALGILKKMAADCNKMGKLIAAAGASEPYVRLDERPEKVARWRDKRRSRRDDGQRKAS